MTIALPKGTRDFYPEDWARQSFLFDHWREVCLEYGFVEYEGPTFEHLELYTQKSGDEIVGQLYNFVDKGGRNVALRPELTPTLARMVAQKGPALKLPIKWFSIPRLFRYERAQKGRLREFFQLNLDILGAESPYAEMELLAAVVALLTRLGLNSDDVIVGVSSRRLLAALLKDLGVEETQRASVYAALDKRLKASPEDFRKLLVDAGLSSEIIARTEIFFANTDLEGLKSFSTDTDYVSAWQELSDLFAWIKGSGLAEYIKLDLSVVRGLAYYTGIVFEVFDRKKSMRAVAGGGRYDHLLAQLGGKPLSGIGFGVGDVVLWDLLESKGITAPSPFKLDYWVVNFLDPSPEMLLFVGKLRNAGYRVGYTLGCAKFKKQMAEADTYGAKALVFWGSEKAGAGEVEVKDSATREQKIVTMESLVQPRQRS